MQAAACLAVYHEPWRDLMLRAASSILKLSLRTQTSPGMKLFATSSRQLYSTRLLAGAMPRLNLFIGRLGSVEAPLQRPHHRYLHASRCMAMAQRQDGRDERYGSPAPQPLHRTPATVPSNLQPSPAPPQRQPALPFQPSAAALPQLQPAAPPPLPSSATQPAAAALRMPAEGLSADYGMPVRPGTGR